MEFSITVDTCTIKSGWSIVIYVSANSEDPDEMSQYWAFQLVLHCCTQKVKRMLCSCVFSSVLVNDCGSRLYNCFRVHLN